MDTPNWALVANGSMARLLELDPAAATHWTERQCLTGGSDAPPPEPLDAALIFAPAGALVPLALQHLDKGGCVVCAGIHMSDIPGFPYAWLWAVGCGLWAVGCGLWAVGCGASAASAPWPI